MPLIFDTANQPSNPNSRRNSLTHFFTSSNNRNNTSSSNNSNNILFDDSGSSIVSYLPRPKRPKPITLPYQSSPNPFHTLDLYLPASGLAPDTPWFIFLHGGYWQDASQSKEVGAAILTRLPTHWAGASIDYRLSPEVGYPGHLLDVKKAIKFLKQAYGLSSAVIMAHGAGACIAYQYLFSELQSCNEYNDDNDNNNASNPYGLRSVQQSNNGRFNNSNSNSNNANKNKSWIKHVITSGGVYDLVQLARDSPYYNKYIADAYGDDLEHWYELSPQNFEWASLNSSCNNDGDSLQTQESSNNNNNNDTTDSNNDNETTYNGPRITLVHSKFDLIVPLQQSLKFDSMLTEAGYNVSLRLLNVDGHDSVLETAELALLALEVCQTLDDEIEKQHTDSANLA